MMKGIALADREQVRTATGFRVVSKEARWFTST
jgi:hypothetical protein